MDEEGLDKLESLRKLSLLLKLRVLFSKLYSIDYDIVWATSPISEWIQTDQELLDFISAIEKLLKCNIKLESLTRLHSIKEIADLLFEPNKSQSC
jgi:hypothetical protein